MSSASMLRSFVVSALVLCLLVVDESHARLNEKVLRRNKLVTLSRSQTGSDEHTLSFSSTASVGSRSGSGTDEHTSSTSGTISDSPSKGSGTDDRTTSTSGTKSRSPRRPRTRSTSFPRSQTRTDSETHSATGAETASWTHSRTRTKRTDTPQHTASVTFGTVSPSPNLSASVTETWSQRSSSQSRTSARTASFTPSVTPTSKTVPPTKSRNSPSLSLSPPARTGTATPGSRTPSPDGTGSRSLSPTGDTASITAPRTRSHSRSRSKKTASSPRSQSPSQSPTLSDSFTTQRTVTRSHVTTTQTHSWTAEVTRRSKSDSLSATHSRRKTPTKQTVSPTATVTLPRSASRSPSATESLSRATETGSYSAQRSISKSAGSPTDSPSDSVTVPRSGSQSGGTPTSSQTDTLTSTASRSTSASESPTAPRSQSKSPSVTPGPTKTPPKTKSPTLSVSTTESKSLSTVATRTWGTQSPTRSASFQRSSTRSNTMSYSVSDTRSASSTRSRSSTLTPSLSGTQSRTVSSESSASWTRSGHTESWTQERSGTRSRSATAPTRTLPTPSSTRIHNTSSQSSARTQSFTHTNDRTPTRSPETPTASAYRLSNTTSPSFSADQTQTQSKFRHTVSNSTTRGSSSPSESAPRSGSRSPSVSSTKATPSFTRGHSTPSISRSIDRSRSGTVSRSLSFERTMTKSRSGESTASASVSVTVTSITHMLPATDSSTLSPTFSFSPPRSKSESSSETKTRTPPPTRTLSRSRSSESTLTRSPRSRTHSRSRDTLSLSRSNERSRTVSRSPTAPRTLSSSVSRTATVTLSTSSTASVQMSKATRSVSASMSRTPSLTDPTWTLVPSPSHTGTAAITVTETITPPPTRTRSASFAASLSNTITPPPTPTVSHTLSAQRSAATLSYNVTITHSRMSPSLSGSEGSWTPSASTSATGTVSLGQLYVIYPTPTSRSQLAAARAAEGSSRRQSSPAATPAPSVSLGGDLIPILFVNSFRLGTPDEERRLIIGVIGDGFASGRQGGSSVYSCITFDTTAAPTFKAALPRVWSVVAVGANITFVAIQFGIDPGFYLNPDTMEVVWMQFSPQCFLSGRMPQNPSVPFAVSSGGTATDPPTAFIGTRATSASSAASGAAAASAGFSGGSPVGALSLGRLSTIADLANCAGDQTDLEFLEHPTRVSWDYLASMPPEPRAGTLETVALYLGALTIDSAIALGIILIRVGFLAYARRRRLRRDGASATLLVRAMADSGFPGRLVILSMFVDAVFKTSIYLLFRLNAILPIAITALCLACWIAVLIGITFAIAGPGFSATYVKRSFLEDHEADLFEEQYDIQRRRAAAFAESIRHDEDDDDGEGGPAAERARWRTRLGGVEDGPTPARALGLSPSSAERLGQTNAPGQSPHSASQRLQQEQQQGAAASPGTGAQGPLSSDDEEEHVREERTRPVRRTLLNALFADRGAWVDGELIDRGDGKRHRARYVRRYGTMFAFFHGGARYWMLVEVAVNVAIAGVDVFATLTQYCPTGALIMLVIIILYTLALIVVRPYKMTFDNIFSIFVALCQVLLVGFTVAVLANNATVEQQRTIVALAFALRMLILVRTMIDLVVMIFHYTRRKIRDSERDKRKAANAQAALDAKARAVAESMDEEMQSVAKPDAAPGSPPRRPLLVLPTLDSARMPPSPPTRLPWDDTRRSPPPPVPMFEDADDDALDALGTHRGTPAFARTPPPLDMSTLRDDALLRHPGLSPGHPRNASRPTPDRQHQRTEPPAGFQRQPTSPRQARLEMGDARTPRVDESDEMAGSDPFRGNPTLPSGWDATPIAAAEPTGASDDSAYGGAIPHYRLADEMQRRPTTRGATSDRGGLAEARAFWQSGDGARMAQSIADAPSAAAGATAVLAAAAAFDSAPHASAIHDYNDDHPAGDGRQRGVGTADADDSGLMPTANDVVVLPSDDYVLSPPLPPLRIRRPALARGASHQRGESIRRDDFDDDLL